jgi:hypothetical protein
MGELLEPKGGAWCRQRWCRADAGRKAEHFDADGCTCHGVAGQTERAAAANPEPLPTSDDSHPRLTILTAKASRLAAFACRACGRNTKRMIESPEMFFRCEECAHAGRWPPARRMA